MRLPREAAPVLPMRFKAPDGWTGGLAPPGRLLFQRLEMFLSALCRRRDE